MRKPSLPPVTITIDQDYQIRFTPETMSQLRKEFSDYEDIPQAMTSHKKGPEFAMATVIVFGLRTENPDIKITPEEVMSCMDMRQVPELTRKLLEAMGGSSTDTHPARPEAT